MTTHPEPGHVLGDRGYLLRDLPSFDDVVARVIRRRGAPAISRASGLPLRMLTHYATLPDNDPHAEHRPIRGREIARLSIAAGSTEIVDYLCQELGGVFVRRPEVAVATGATMCGTVAAVTREFADVQLGTARALDDGLITGDEAAALDVELEELVCAVERVRLGLREAMERRPLAKAPAR